MTTAPIAVLPIPPDKLAEIPLTEEDALKIGKLVFNAVRGGEMHMREVTNLMYTCLRFYRLNK